MTQPRCPVCGGPILDLPHAYGTYALILEGHKREVEHREAEVKRTQELTASLQHQQEVNSQLLAACEAAAIQSHHSECQQRKNVTRPCNCFVGKARAAIAAATP